MNNNFAQREIWKTVKNFDLVSSSELIKNLNQIELKENTVIKIELKSNFLCNIISSE